MIFKILALPFKHLGLSLIALGLLVVPFVNVVGVFLVLGLCLTVARDVLRKDIRMHGFENWGITLLKGIFAGAIILFYILPGLLAWMVWTWLGVVFLIFGIFLLPAALLVFTRTGGVVDAFSPAKIFFYISGRYLLAWLILLVVACLLLGLATLFVLYTAATIVLPVLGLAVVIYLFALWSLGILAFVVRKR
ncbi:DUF4013 domain-containing protein [Candidatus Woesearchaeota archaeon]|nr:DUF4013 domain-containing protein [Candidatus Woesearchaeota archaeon]